MKFNDFDCKGKMNYLFIFVMSLLVLVLGGLVIAQSLSSEDLVVELNNLSSELVDGGYDWLVNYSVDYPSADIEVYLEDGDVVVAVIENTENFLEFSVSPNSSEEFRDVSSDGEYKVYFSGLGENESYFTFDLRVVGEKIPFNIYEKKKRIDEIQELIG